MTNPGLRGGAQARLLYGRLLLSNGIKYVNPGTDVRVQAGALLFS